ncbi:MAG TPA: tyrosine-type recombinase/integrase [Xanthomonadales bacterium]|nr:tyrosine-type recombinase/integrase [Xanthomonadales bacterium]
MTDNTATPAVPVAGLIQRFFTEYLVNQRALSPATVASYRDTVKLLLMFIAKRVKRSPAELTLTDLDVTAVQAFLTHLETHRGNCVRSRNARLAAIHTFVRFAAHHEPASLAILQRILSVPLKRHERPLLGYLSRAEIEAIIAAPDASTWIGQRDAALFATLYNSGARISEALALRVCDFVDSQAPCVHLLGKGRKQRMVPLWTTAARRLRIWVTSAKLSPTSPLFPSRAGQPMTRANAAQRLAIAKVFAAKHLPQLKAIHVSPHTIRHTTAMHLLQSGVDLSVIALWLGHESPSTTHLYVEADLEMKRRALQTIQPLTAGSTRRLISDRLLAFLDAL